MAVFRRISERSLQVAAIAGVALFAAACTLQQMGQPDRGPTASAGELQSLDKNGKPVERTVPPAVMNIPGLPVPGDMEVVLSDTVIAGQDDNWTGQVVMFSGSYHPVQIVEFMRKEMPDLGWDETAILRSRRTSITYVQDSRFATVRIMDRNGGTEIDVVVAPVKSSASDLQ